MVKSLYLSPGEQCFPPGWSSAKDEPFVLLLILFIVKFKSDIYSSAEKVVAQCLHQREDTEARGDCDYQGAGCLQGLSLLRLDFTKERLQECVASSNLIIWKGKKPFKNIL